MVSYCKQTRVSIRIMRICSYVILTKFNTTKNKHRKHSYDTDADVRVYIFVSIVLLFFGALWSEGPGSNSASDIVWSWLRGGDVASLSESWTNRFKISGSVATYINRVHTPQWSTDHVICQRATSICHFSSHVRPSCAATEFITKFIFSIYCNYSTNIICEL